jgi:aspartyl-tRNA(Asn)/glutamyl-tRNA(Gln) amidotransferase subunit A
MKNELCFKTAAELSQLLNQKAVTSQEVTQAFIDRTQALDGQVKAYLSLNPEDALAQAKASDERRTRGETLGPLDGIPVTLKDVLAVKGQPLTCGSKILEHYVSPYDATCVENLQKKGLVLWGRANMDEFAMGSSTENSAYFPTGNPWALDRSPGGSSGGSAAAVAANFAPLSIGSDTGGSIRQPASFCGLVGVKPTYGRISRCGLVAFASSLDQLGPFAHTTEDAAYLLEAMAGYDPKDSTSLNQPVPAYHKQLDGSLKGKKIGVARDYLGEGLHEDVRKAFDKALSFYKDAGCEIVDITLPHTNLAVPVYYVIATAEASSNLARYDGIRYTHRSSKSTDAIDIFAKSRAEGFGQEVKRRIILGTYVLNSGYYDAYYLQAQKVRSLMRMDFEKAFENVDAILTPTAPTTAFKRGEKVSDPLAMYLNDIYTIPTSLAGIAGLSFHGGFSPEGLPIGLQLIGNALQESALLNFAHVFEKAHDYARTAPTLS